MRTLRALVFGIAAGVALAPAAIAADLGGGPAGRSLKDAPLPAEMPLFTWSGLYIGAHVGYGWTDLDWTAAGTTVNDNGSGWFGGGQMGYNWQRGALVFGVEADLSSGGMGGSAACPGFTCSHDVNWLASVRGRLGVAANGNRTLFYATAGGAWADVDYSSTAGPGFSDRLSGWVVGGGIEHMLTPRMTARVEYLYYAFDGVTAPAGTLSGGPVALDPSMQTVRFGLNVKF
jgi:outer membrane immunogenic protein